MTRTEFTAAGARCSLFVLVSGSGACSSLGAEREIAAPCLVWLPTHHSARLSLAAGARGFVLRVPEKSLGRALPSGPIASHVRGTVSERLVLPDIGTVELARLQGLFDQIETELYELAPGAASALHHCLSLLLIEIWRASKPTRVAMDAMPKRIVDDFLHLAELHLQSHWTVSDYASRIGVSRDRLNTAVQSTIGTTPHRHLQSRLIEEAKELLLGSNLQVAEVAFKLGFKDAAYFNRFFQRNLGVSPGRFRRSSALKQASPVGRKSFAAWP